MIRMDNIGPRTLRAVVHLSRLVVLMHSIQVPRAILLLLPALLGGIVFDICALQRRIVLFPVEWITMDLLHGVTRLLLRPRQITAPLLRIEEELLFVDYQFRCLRLVVEFAIHGLHVREKWLLEQHFVSSSFLTVLFDFHCFVDSETSFNISCHQGGARLRGLY